ncbi:MAG TPA: DUF4124 domain-containing protein [Usitatibacter sp.]|nr:DUF4124 domain-containing protein [Usitatibacter sp.]
MKRIALCIAALYVPLAGAAYKCVDEKGIAHYGDTPPAGCAAVVMYEVKPNGTVIRRIDPTPTPEQAQTMRAENERKREAEKQAAEQKRKDTALLATFSSEREFDVVRDRSIEPIRSRIKSSQERIAAIEKRERQIEDELEFYKAGKSKAHNKKGERDAPPVMLVTEQERLKAERQTLVAGIASQENEIKQVHERFDLDKRRWLQIKTGAADPAPAAATAAKAAAEPRASKKGS